MTKKKEFTAHTRDLTDEEMEKLKEVDELLADKLKKGNIAGGMVIEIDGCGSNTKKISTILLQISAKLGAEMDATPLELMRATLGTFCTLFATSVKEGCALEAKEEMLSELSMNIDRVMEEMEARKARGEVTPNQVMDKVEKAIKDGQSPDAIAKMVQDLAKKGAGMRDQLPTATINDDSTDRFNEISGEDWEIKPTTNQSGNA